MNKPRLAVMLVIAGLLAAFFAFGGHRYLSIEQFRAQQAAIQSFFQAHPWEAGAAFFALYVAVTGLSVPGAAVMTLAAGAIFGLLWGVLIVSFASTLGATLAFLTSRFLLRDWVQARFGDRLKPVNDGIARRARSTCSRCVWCRRFRSSR